MAETKPPVVITSVSCHDEYGDGPRAARIELDEELIERVKTLWEAVNKAGAHVISERDYSPEWGRVDEDGRFEVGMDRLDVMMLEVWHDGEFQWSAYLKNTTVRFETGPISLKTLRPIGEEFESPVDDDVRP